MIQVHPPSTTPICTPLNPCVHLSLVLFSTTHRYLCDVLDTLPSSVDVRHVRREVSRRIDVLTDENAGTKGNSVELEQLKRNKAEKNMAVLFARASQGKKTINATRNVVDSVLDKSLAAPRRGAIKFPRRGDDTGAVCSTRDSTDRGMGSGPTTPVRVGCGTSGGSSAQRKGVRFLLGCSESDDEIRPLEGVKSNTAALMVGNVRRIKNSELKTTPAREGTADGAGQNERGLPLPYWNCAVCNKRNGEDRVECVVCRRCPRPCSLKMTDGEAAGSRPLGVDAVCGNIEWGAGDEEVDGDGQEINAVNTTSSCSTHAVVGAGRCREPTERVTTTGSRRNPTERVGRWRNGVRDAREGEGYDFSGFARMRQATDPIVKARLGLTGEIKSLLLAIRGK